MHGHLFAPDWVHYGDGQSSLNGAMSDSPSMRDYNANAFLTNLIWNTRGERQCFQFGPVDTQEINWRVAKDPHAQVSVITGAWSVSLFRSNLDFSEIRKTAAKLQQVDSDHMNVLRSPYTKARVRIWSMAEFIEAPMEALQGILDGIGQDRTRRLSEAPKMVELHGFGQFLQNLKNQGMHPYMMGDFPVERGPMSHQQSLRKPYLVQ